MFFLFGMIGRTFPVGFCISSTFILFCREQTLKLRGPGRTFLLFFLQFFELQFKRDQLFFQIGAFFHKSADLFQSSFRTGRSGTQLGKFPLEFFDLFFPEIVFLYCVL